MAYHLFWYLYLIKIDIPIGTHRHSAQYYGGFATNVRKRFLQHQKGKGARLLAHAVQRGIPFSVCRTWRFSTYWEAKAAEQYAKKSVKNYRRMDTDEFTFPCFL